MEFWRFSTKKNVDCLIHNLYILITCWNDILDILGKIKYIIKINVICFLSPPPPFHFYNGTTGKFLIVQSSYLFHFLLRIISFNAFESRFSQEPIFRLCYFLKHFHNQTKVGLICVSFFPSTGSLKLNSSQAIKWKARLRSSSCRHLALSSFPSSLPFPIIS